MDKFAKYRIIRELKSGGMGVVYLAEDTREKRTVALKLVKQSTDYQSRAEVKAAEYGAKLQEALARVDANVPKVWGYGSLHGQFFIDMEYIADEDLSSVMDRQKLPYKAVIRIAAAICSTLSVAHDLTTIIDGEKIGRIFHGDIKPQNIRLTLQGQVKLLDFGIAKGTSLGRHAESGRKEVER